MNRAKRLAEDFFAVKNGLLHFGKSGTKELISVDEIATAAGTPCFVYDEAVLQRQLDSLRHAFGDDFSIYYSMKANPDPRVVQFFVRAADGIEVASAGEMDVALSQGAEAKAILFAGPGKRDFELEQALRLAIGEIHVESMTEFERLDQIASRVLSRGSRQNICLRINPMGESQGGAMRMGGLPSQFGIDAEQATEVAKLIRDSKNLNLHGIHLFAGTQILDAATLLDQYERFVEFAAELTQNVGCELNSIDFGGGLGVAYFSNDGDLDLKQLKTGLVSLVQNIRHKPGLKDAGLMIEPGRFLTAPAGVYVTRVTDIKVSRGKKFVILDGGMHHHLAASGNLGQVIKRDYPLACVNRLEETEADLEPVDLVGPLCTPLDRIGRQVELPPLEVGDLIGVFQSGAYGLTASPIRFLSHEIAAETYVQGGRVLVRRTEVTDAVNRRVEKQQASACRTSV